MSSFYFVNVMHGDVAQLHTSMALASSGVMKLSRSQSYGKHASSVFSEGLRMTAVF